MRPIRREVILIAGLLLVAVALRSSVVLSKYDNLRDDRDSYLAIAHSLAAGNGFAFQRAPGEASRPTAFRPPLYPLVLAGVFRSGAGDWGVALLHVLLGTSTVLLTYLIGHRLGLRRAALLAAGLVAVDPLLLQYTSFPMTETLCTFLVTLLMAALVGVGRKDDYTQSTEDQPQVEPRVSFDKSRFPRRQIMVGVIFGLSVLCRPTILVFGLLTALWWLGEILRKKRRPSFLMWPAVLSAAVVVAPWLVRNVLVFDRPILATTHGGYTLLLGNNPVFYREVVARPWGTVWDDAAKDRTQAAWLDGIEADLRIDLARRRTDETSRDRWMYRRALQNMAGNRGLFLRACWLRFGRFWNVVPLSPARRTIPPAAVWAVGMFYGAINVALLIGLLSLLKKDWSGWLALGLLIVGFCLVHLFYWSNTRMRAPVIPAIAIIASQGLGVLANRGQPAGQKKNERRDSP